VEHENLIEIDIVIEIDADLLRGVWRLLRISKIIPREDGLIRKVEVVNSTGKNYLRSISKHVLDVRT
jgi:hypothetical protein